MSLSVSLVPEQFWLELPLPEAPQQRCFFHETFWGVPALLIDVFISIRLQGDPF